MGYSEKFKRKHAERIASKDTHKERVLESFKVGKEILTIPISEAIRKDHDLINESILSLDISDKDMGKKKHELQQLKKKVADHYAINKAEVFAIQDEINKILGILSPNHNTPKA